MSSSCPFCHISLPYAELEWHADAHLVEDGLKRDIEVVQQIALEPPSTIFLDQFLDPATPSLGCRMEGSYSRRKIYEMKLLQEKTTLLVSSQIKGSFKTVEGGLMCLLKRCLEMEAKNSISIIAGYINHFQTSISEDSGWGCGWRNIQMLSSHLLVQRPESREVLFGGSGFVPDVLSLQKWLEIAWEKGFDKPGSDFFDHKIYGSRKWIGTTECAALIRSFGLLAKVVDFDYKSIKSCASPVKSFVAEAEANSRNKSPKVKKRKVHVYGPMDKFLHRKCSNDSEFDSVAENESEYVKDSYCFQLKEDIPKDCHNSNYSEKLSGPQVLAKWVWNYFFSEASGGSENGGHVFISQKTPLYFQHDGHSRTIIGIQKQKESLGVPEKYTLLIFDPSQSTAALERALKENRGWQKSIKRGVLTLSKPQYQICYVDPGIAKGEELEKLKTIDSVLVKM